MSTADGNTARAGLRPDGHNIPAIREDEVDTEISFSVSAMSDHSSIQKIRKKDKSKSRNIEQSLQSHTETDSQSLESSESKQEGSSESSNDDHEKTSSDSAKTRASADMRREKEKNTRETSASANII